MSKKIILAFDTSTENLGVALWNYKTNESQIFSEVMYRGHAERLHSKIEELLIAGGWTVSDIACIATTRGPGSFTGVRIGLAAAIGFKRGLNVPLFTFSSFDIFAAELAKNYPITVWIDSCAGDIFHQEFSTSGKANSAIEVMEVTKAATKLNKDNILCGNGAISYFEKLKGIKLPANDKQYVNPLTIAKMAYEKLQNNKKTDNSPLYIRKLTYKKLNEQRKNIG